jgi:hypothetical protein
MSSLAWYWCRRICQPSRVAPWSAVLLAVACCSGSRPGRAFSAVLGSVLLGMASTDRRKPRFAPAPSMSVGCRVVWLSAVVVHGLGRHFTTPTIMVLHPHRCSARIMVLILLFGCRRARSGLARRVMPLTDRALAVLFHRPWRHASRDGSTGGRVPRRRRLPTCSA